MIETLDGKGPFNPSDSECTVTTSIRLYYWGSIKYDKMTDCGRGAYESVQTAATPLKCVMCPELPHMRIH